ncbi:MAG: class III signal peptide-containing protein [Candidatus Omnitrophica bacterium]|nr:class III signal peptide-containing protein [Candidatus Omnitrophota bacterium]
MTKVKKGQSTLEYIILVTGVVVVILAFVGQKSGVFQTTVTNTLTNATKQMPAMIGKWELPSGKAGDQGGGGDEDK